MFKKKWELISISGKVTCTKGPQWNLDRFTTI